MHDAEKEFIFRIDTRVDEIGERVSRIEGKLDSKSPKSFKKRISESGGLVALFLSIAIASFTLYDKLVLQPEKDLIQQEISFRNDINELGNVSATIAGLDWINNPQAANAAVRAYAPTRLALIDKITKSDLAMPGVLNFADRLLLANELQAFGRLDEALAQANLATEIATDALQAANAYWTKAGLNGNLNNLTEMRDDYSLALIQFKSMGLKNSAGWVMQVYLQWIASELAGGTCARARDVYSEMVNDSRNPDVWPGTKQMLRDQFAQMLSQSPKTCDLILVE